MTTFRGRAPLHAEHSVLLVYMYLCNRNRNRMNLVYNQTHDVGECELLLSEGDDPALVFSPWWIRVEGWLS